MEANIEARDYEHEEWLAELAGEDPGGDANEPTDAEVRADWLLEKIAAEQERLDRIQEVADRRIQMIRDHAERESVTHQKRIDYLQMQVRLCFPMDPEDFERIYGKKSCNLAHGTAGYRASRDTVEIEDKDKALAFAKSHNLEVKVRESVGKTPLIEYVKKHGEVPDGCTFVPGEDSFYVKAGG